MVERTPWINPIAIEGKRVLFGVSGGIACYKSAAYVRLLKQLGSHPTTVLTRNATRFISPMTFSVLSGEDAHVDTFAHKSSIAHIEYTQKADVFVVCPATANIMAKAAHGIADDLLSTMILAYRGGVIFFPSMNPGMFQNPATQQNIQRLRSMGHHVVEPGEGEMACGDTGKGRLVEMDEFLFSIQRYLLPKPLLDKKIIVTAGPTREPLDPVRFISNRSSGKMGYAISWAASLMGASVELISGPVSLPVPPGIEKVQHVETAKEMEKMVLAAFPASDATIMTAAVSDFSPLSYAKEKIKKNQKIDELHIIFKKNTDILEALSRRKKRGQVLVGFCAETGDLEQKAREKMAKKPVDLLVCNDVTQKGAGFDTDTNKVLMLFRDGSIKKVPLMQKTELAMEIVNTVAGLLSSHGASPG